MSQPQTYRDWHQDRLANATEPFGPGTSTITAVTLADNTPTLEPPNVAADTKATKNK